MSAATCVWNIANHSFRRLHFSYIGGQFTFICNKVCNLQWILSLVGSFNHKARSLKMPIKNPQPLATPSIEHVGPEWACFSCSIAWGKGGWELKFFKKIICSLYHIFPQMSGSGQMGEYYRDVATGDLKISSGFEQIWGQASWMPTWGWLLYSRMQNFGFLATTTVGRWPPPPLTRIHMVVSCHKCQIFSPCLSLYRPFFGIALNLWELNLFWRLKPDIQNTYNLHFWVHYFPFDTSFT